MKTTQIVVLCLSLFGLTCGCVTMKVEPIHITMDVNVRVQIEQEVEDFFGELDAASESLTSN